MNERIFLYSKNIVISLIIHISSKHFMMSAVISFQMNQQEQVDLKQSNCLKCMKNEWIGWCHSSRWKWRREIIIFFHSGNNWLIWWKMSELGKGMEIRNDQQISTWWMKLEISFDAMKDIEQRKEVIIMKWISSLNWWNW